MECGRGGKEDYLNHTGFSVLEPPRNEKFKLLHKEQARKTQKFKVIALA